MKSITQYTIQQVSVAQRRIGSSVGTLLLTSFVCGAVIACGGDDSALPGNTTAGRGGTGGSGTGGTVAGTTGSPGGSGGTVTAGNGGRSSGGGSATGGTSAAGGMGGMSGTAGTSGASGMAGIGGAAGTSGMSGTGGMACVEDTLTNADNCGACGDPCSGTNATARACANGVCHPVCQADFLDCNPDNGLSLDDGCDTNPSTSTASCGACGRACNPAGVATLACTGGRCAPTCGFGFGDCVADSGGTTDDGCETDFDANATCGTACGTHVPCAVGEGCIAGACTATVAGVVMVSVPLSAGGQGQRYNILHQTTPVDVSAAGTNVIVRAYAPHAINAQLNIFLRSASTPAYQSSVLVPVSDLHAGFLDITVPVPPASDNFDPTMLTLVTVEVEAAATNTGPWQTPATVVYFDSVISTNGVINDTFDTNPLGPLFQESGAKSVAGSAETFFATFP